MLAELDFVYDYFLALIRTVYASLSFRLRLELCSLIIYKTANNYQQTSDFQHYGNNGERPSTVIPSREQDNRATSQELEEGHLESATMGDRQIKTDKPARTRRRAEGEHTVVVNRRFRVGHVLIILLIRVNFF